MYTYKYRWQTTDSPTRPRYSGVEEVRLNEDNDVKARQKCIEQVTKRMCFYPGEVIIISRNIFVKTS